MPISGPLGVEVVYGVDTAVGRQYWANRYELNVPGSDGVDAEDIADAFATSLRPILLQNFYLDHVVVSTWAADGQPYDPLTFFTKPYNQRGTRGNDLSTTVLPINNVVHVRKLTTAGRTGNVFIRGYLQEEDISSDVSGAVTLSDVSKAQVANALNDLVTNLPQGCEIVMIGPVGGVQVIRPVTGFSVAKLGSHNLRTKRKSRLVNNAVESMSGLLADGGITIDEIPAFVEAAAAVVRALGTELPPLLP